MDCSLVKKNTSVNFCLKKLVFISKYTPAFKVTNLFWLGGENWPLVFYQRTNSDKSHVSVWLQTQISGMQTYTDAFGESWNYLPHTIGLLSTCFSACKEFGLHCAKLIYLFVNLSWLLWHWTVLERTFLMKKGPYHIMPEIRELTLGSRGESNPGE